MDEFFKKVLKFSALINSSLEFEEIRRRSIEAIMELLNCEAASLLFYDEEKEELYFDVALGEKAEKVKTIRLKLGQGIAGWVALHKEPLIINDVQNDPRFFKGADKKSGFTTRNMICVPVMVRNKLLGVIQAINKRQGDFTEEDLELLTALSHQIAVAIENARLYNELKETFFNVVFALADTIEKRDPYTGGHTRRVMTYSVAIGEEMGLPKDQLELLKLSAILHDIGKIGIKDDVLLKQSRLTKEEYELIKKHTIFGEEILKHIKQMKEVIPGVKYHHERPDGKGYPEGLKGDQIPLIARIIAVADTFDAMVTDRPYRKGLSFETAIEELKRCSGTQFDPKAVEAFIKVFKKRPEIFTKN
ncbi:MAG: GAF domain-containing protein [Thermodesulfobacteria bacterium]|nr:GAF domain-containing protein [Thermodesulfobacteriota bacterium]